MEVSQDQNNNNDSVIDRFKSNTWLKSDADPKDYMYEPVNFLRSHCKENDISEVTTQIWDVVFEPGQDDVFATCGGRYVCVFSVSTGQLLMKYTHKQEKHEMYSLSWTVLGCGNILASGSSCGEIRLYHPAREVSFYDWTYKKGVSVSAVQFHTTEPSWLFSASSDSVVLLWNIGQPDPPSYTKGKHVQLLKMIADMGDMYSMIWVEDMQWVMVGAMQGIVGWKISADKIKEKKFLRHKPTAVEFSLPGVATLNAYVDSVCSLGSGLVAAKAVGLGKIYIFRAEFKDNITHCEVEVLIEFGWQKTYNFYMNIGGSTELGLMGCGDDQGYTWVYKLPTWLTSNQSSSTRALPQRILPIGRLPWPDLGPQHSGAPMLDKMAFSPCGQYIVAVTNNNIVAIWKMGKVEN